MKAYNFILQHIHTTTGCPELRINIIRDLTLFVVGQLRHPRLDRLEDSGVLTLADAPLLMQAAFTGHIPTHVPSQS